MNTNIKFYAIWITIGKIFLNFAESKRGGNTRHNDTTSVSQFILKVE